jgi:hypothetical protein
MLSTRLSSLPTGSVDNFIDYRPAAPGRAWCHAIPQKLQWSCSRVGGSPDLALPFTVLPGSSWLQLPQFGTHVFIELEKYMKPSTGSQDHDLHIDGSHVLGDLTFYNFIARATERAA